LASAQQNLFTRPVRRSAIKSSIILPAPIQTMKLKMRMKKRTAFPKSVRPMLATLVDKPFDAPGWLYEIKWDGYRAIALMNKGKVQLISRNNKSFNEKFYPVYDALKKWKINAVVDGEITVLNNRGIAHFGSLQNWRSEADGDLIYYVFDILWLNRKNLESLPLIERRRILEDNLPVSPVVRFSESFETTATKFLSETAKLGIEGIIAKKQDSIYQEGERTRDWVKMKSNKRHEVIIGGFTENENSPKKFSSILVGVFDHNKLDYIGKIGTGFNQSLQKELLAKMRKLVVKNSPFSTVPDVNKPSRFRPHPPKAKVTWIRPELVCEVSYAELTEDGVMRHPSFEGLREDKNAKDVKKEKAVSKETVMHGTHSSIKYAKPVEKKDRKTLLNPAEESQVKNIDGHNLKFTNLSKIYWPKEGYTKRDMLNYYYLVAPYILPYLKDRPQSLNRFPNGIAGKSFYHKNVTDSAPDWIKLHPYTTSEGEKKNFLVPQDEASILYMANTGAIEMNPWNSTIFNEDNPDWCLIDLDPSNENSFEQVIVAAQTTKQVLDELKVPGYPKTSGSTGIHIYIPLAAKYSYDECQLFGKIIATRVQKMLPRFTSIERLTKNREGKLYIDYLQNRPKATLAAPYSLRPKPGAPVSMPLHWEEVRKGLKISDFTIANAMDRLKKEGDIFKPVLGKGINLNKILKEITKGK
jgi:bifunctional non-homologous end joining protein LigD